MPELYLEDALTVGELKKALEKVPDDALVGKSIFDLSGHVEKVDRVLFCKKHNILSFDQDRHNGAFSDEEFDEDDFEVIVELEG